jgi:hypothetical protein
MEFETLNALKEGLYLGQMMMIQIIGLIITLMALAGLAVYLIGVIWFCSEEKRRIKTSLRTQPAAVPVDGRKPAPVVPIESVRARVATRRSGNARCMDSGPCAVLAHSASTIH